MTQTLDPSAFARALKTDPVILVVSEDNNPSEEITVNKAFLALHSELFAANLADVRIKTEPGTFEGEQTDTMRIDIDNVSANAAKCFTRWCYSERLERCPPNASAELRQAMKVTYLDLWVFCDIYSIPTLQNQTMAALCEILSVPSLLNKNDVSFIFARPTPTSPALRHLAVMCLIVQLDDHNPRESISDYMDLVQRHPELLVMVYEIQKLWVYFEAVGEGKKNTETGRKETRSEWEQFLNAKALKEKLRVPAKEPTGWVMEMCGASGQMQKGVLKNFTPGEVIELD